MGQFFKFMFASMLGTLIIGVVLIFIFVGALISGLAGLGSGISFGNNSVSKVADKSILHMTLDQQIVDRGSEQQLNLDFGPFKNSGSLGLNDILESIDKAAADDRIKAIFLDLTVIPAGMATMKEIREKLAEFKANSGKPIIAFSDFYTQRTYYLASVANEVYVTPQGGLDFRGLRSEYMFYKGLFEKLDIDVQFIRGSNNKFKSFGEVFTETEMSEKNAEQTRALISGIWDDYLGTVGVERKLDKAKLNGIAETLQVRTSKDAVDAGMLDGAKYRDEVLDILREKIGAAKGEDLEMAELGKYKKAYVAKKKSDNSTDSTAKGAGTKGGRIAVVYAEGSIIDGESEDGSIGSTTMSAAIREAREDTTIKALVLRVNSPGGSGLASDVIWREVALAKQRMPVVVSMGDVAASGGYYISCGATKIFAQENTITGSIGVFGIIPNMQGFFNNKLGITFDGEQTNKYAGMMTTSRALTEEEKGIIQGYVDDFYNTFKKRVSEGRMAAGLAQMTETMVDSIGQGRVWTGTDAKARGLVDELGGLEDAIAEAEKLAGLTNAKTVNYPEEEDFFKKLMEDLNMESKVWATEQVLGADMETAAQLKKIADVKKITGIQARMPFDLRVY
ncbi:MAG: signal peptide peptidase SppA [Flavobacteriales bacterium]